jgi:putative N6-adenine-specific DNA methylase
MSEIFEMVAKTFQGLEGVLCDELKALGAEEVNEGIRVVSFKGDKEMMYRANFCCRTALRILKPFYKFKSGDADDLYEQVKRFDWSTVMNVDDTFSIDSTVYSEDFRHSRFVTYRVKDAIADFFMEKCDKRPSIRLTDPDYHFDVHISGHEVTLSLDSSGDPLYKRGWRVAQTDAPINEVLAAGIIKLSGWDGTSNFVDPMCGSGTFLIEAAMIAANINPGVYRKGFAFEKWPDFDRELLDKIYNDDSNEREFNFKIYGSDVSPKAIAITNLNIKSAGVAKYIEVEQKAIQDIEQAPEKGVLITNPPYGERIEVDDLDSLYASLGEKLKKVYRGYNAWVIGYDRENFDNIGLKASVHYPLLNGELECELREYVIFDGSYDDLRARGESIKNPDFRASEDRKNLKRPEFEETFVGDDKDGEAEEAKDEEAEEAKDGEVEETQDGETEETKDGEEGEHSDDDRHERRRSFHDDDRRRGGYRDRRDDDRNDHRRSFHDDDDHRRGGFGRRRDDDDHRGPRRFHDDDDHRRGGFGHHDDDDRRGPRRFHDDDDHRRGGFGHRDDDDRRGPRRFHDDDDHRRGGFGHRDDDDHRGPRRFHDDDDHKRGGFGHHDDDDHRRGGFGHRDDDDHRRGGFGHRDDDDHRRGGFGHRDDDRRGGFGRRRDDDDRRGPRRSFHDDDDHRRGGFGHRDDDDDSRKFRSTKPYAERGREEDGEDSGYWHSEQFAKKVVRHREPTLGAEKERPIIHGRRNAWKRQDLDKDDQNNNKDEQ